jgi:phage baseplate assembly protein V
MSQFDRSLGRFKRRITGMVSRGTVTAVDDASGIQALQVEGLADEAHDGVERMQDYGFTSVPLPGAETVLVFAGGLRSHGLIVALGDRRYRLKGLEGGEVAMYDDQAQVVHLQRDGILVFTEKKVTIEGSQEVLIRSDTKVTVEAPQVIIDSADVQLGGDGPAVARVGDDVDLATGKIISGSATVKAA